ncbi:MAG: type II toxin-antitoxin system RelE/ParE family toxin [Gemmatimonadota bacterium]
MDIDDGREDDTQGAEWQVRVFHDRRGRYPAFHKKDRPFLARSFRKLEYLAEVVRFQRIENIPRELVDTIRGAVKELRVDKQIRVLFSWEHATHTILVLEAERKKNGGIDEKVIRRAIENREEWQEGGAADPLDVVRKSIGG